MKRIVVVCIVALAAIGAVSAQGFGGGPGMMGPGFQAQAQAQVAQVKSTIEGKLALVQGHPAVVVKDKTYFVRMPQYLYGFVDGLKEGATVKLEGYESALPYAPNSLFFQVATLTIGSKSYDLSQFIGQGQMGFGMQGGRGRGGYSGGRGRW
ncbi:MAG: hypothetical protein KKA67_02905 [Spirochaetes bacterium]|nr:hypothetical protein [Spirochaetota bacterium]MBU1081804.1 hypothetical protein [Spirochaetota bacterium]